VSHKIVGSEQVTQPKETQVADSTQARTTHPDPVDFPYILISIEFRLGGLGGDLVLLELLALLLASLLRRLQHVSPCTHTGTQ
jgi:hypothetical protein